MIYKYKENVSNNKTVTTAADTLASHQVSR